LEKALEVGSGCSPNDPEEPDECSWRIAPILALPALIGAYLVLGAGASAEAPGTTTLNLKELEKGSTFAHVRNIESASQKSNLQGEESHAESRLGQVFWTQPRRSGRPSDRRCDQ
jgi:hypothetical protein